ncbi:MAG: C10 family peptidase, partial [Muribaculaceae bacterium]|nr:C10 family peptidase [Muribaculaceae bacterium]
LNFSNNKGYALVSARPGDFGVYAIIEKGNFSFDTANEEEDELFLHAITISLNLDQYLFHGDINFSPDDLPAYPTIPPQYFEGYKVIKHNKPQLLTVWGQGDPYNSLFPSFKGRTAPAGCVMVATAQVLSKFKIPESVSWSYQSQSGYSVLDWDSILRACRRTGGSLSYASYPSETLQVAHLHRFLAVQFNASYGAESTGAKTSAAVSWLKQIGLRASSLKDYDERMILEALSADKIILCRGNEKRYNFLLFSLYSGGHSWVIDGSLVGSKNNKTWTLMHCNMGWHGRANGYYISKLFDTESIAIPEGGPVDEPANLKYHLQFSVISK